MEGQNTEFVELLARLDERTERIDDRVDKLTYILIEGNGTPPVITQIARIDERLKNVEDTVKEQKVPKHVWITIAVSIILGITAIGFGVFHGGA